MQTGSGGCHLTWRSNKGETAAQAVVYRGDDNYYSSWDTDTAVAWYDAAGTLYQTAEVSNFESKNYVFWGSIYNPVSYVGKVLRKPYRTGFSEDLIYSYKDSGGVARSVSIVNDRVSKVIGNTLSTTSVPNGTDIAAILFSAPAGTLANVGDTLELEVWGTYGATANGKQIKIWVGGFALDTGFPTTSSQTWKITCRGVVENGSSIKWTSIHQVNGLPPILQFLSSAVTITAQIDVGCYVTTSASGDVVVQGATFRYMQ